MATFFDKEKHVLIQLESDDDWHSFFNNCEGSVIPVMPCNPVIA